MVGLSDQQSQLKVGFIPDFELGALLADSLEVILTDLSLVNDELPNRLDGILGVAFMQQYKIAFNFERRKVYFWRLQKIDNKTFAMINSHY